MVSFDNFYKPAPAWAQRLAAVMKSLGGSAAAAAVSPFVPAGLRVLVGVAGLVVAAVGEAIEKLTAAPAPAAAPDPRTDPTMAPADVVPETGPNRG